MQFRTFLAVLVGAAGPALAQTGAPIEIGIDAGISRVTASANSVSQSLTITQIPVQSVRVTFPVNPHFSIEPALSLISFSGDGDSQTSYAVEVGAPIYFTPDYKRPQVYARPAIGFTHDTFFSGGGGDHTMLGAGIGVRVPSGDRFAFRFEGRYQHFSEDRGISSHSIGLIAGLSFLTR